MDGYRFGFGRRTTVGLAVAGLAVGLLLASGGPGAAAGQRTAGGPAATTRLAPAQGVLFGAFAGLAGRSPAAAIGGLETDVGHRLDLHRVYQLWDDPHPGASVTQDVRAGRIPVLSIKPKFHDGHLLTWAAVAAGKADTAIAAQADKLGVLPGRLILTFHHEPDVDTRAGYGTAQEYVAAWRHYRSVFQSRGVRNVEFGWIASTGAFSRPGVAAAFYPGDDAVDWIGVDAFNWNGCKAGLPTGWRSLREVTVQFAAWSAPHGKPLMLAEWGSVEDATQPGRKAAWILDAVAAAKAWPQLKGMAYFDTTGSCRWELATSPSARQAFSTAAADPWTRTR